MYILYECSAFLNLCDNVYMYLFLDSLFSAIDLFVYSYVNIPHCSNCCRQDNLKIR